MEIPLYISELMTPTVIFYEKEQEKELLKFCLSRDITFLPSDDFIHIYTLEDGKFVRKQIPNLMKLYVADEAFNLKTLEKFTKDSPVKFVYQNDEIIGVLHFSDYNKNPAYIHLYAKILDFEKTLREILAKEHTNQDLIQRYENEIKKQKSEKLKKLYQNKINLYEKNKELIEKSKPFEHFDLTELISFANHKLKLKLQQEKIKDLRNKIMHFKQNIHNKDGQIESLLFDFDSFFIFKNEVEELFKAFEKIK